MKNNAISNNVKAIVSVCGWLFEKKRRGVEKKEGCALYFSFP